MTARGERTEHLPGVSGAPGGSSIGGSLPDQLGRYRLRGRIGEGGMGVVHLGLDPAGRAVAVKVLRAHVAHDPDARARLAREVSTLRRVRHPLVAEVIDADVDGEQPYVVTRFVPGSGLDVTVREGGPLPAEQLLRLGRGLSDALGAIHAVHVVHRDLKPANVLMLDGDPVVIDFGIAHVADDVRLTSTGLVMGTPGYLSPEVIDGSQVTQATDWWGWAATLAFAASGRPPFGRGPMDVVIDRVRRGECDLDGVDARLRPLLQAALSVDPCGRPVTGEVLAALDRYAAGEHATVVVPVSAPTLPVSAATTLLPDMPATMVAPAAAGAPAPAAVAATLPVAAPTAGAMPAAAPPAAALAARTAGAPDVPMDQLLPGSRGIGEASHSAHPEPVGPPPRRTGVLLALLVALVGGALAYPVMLAAGVLVLSVLARTVERNRFSLARRRMERGPRRSDLFVATLASPWHLVRSALVSVLAAVLPAMLGLATVFSAGLAVAGSAGAPAPGSLTAVGAGATIALLTAWWGPGGSSLRRGTRTSIRAAVPASAQLWVVLLLLLGGLLATAAAVNAGAPHWDPLRVLPFGVTLP